MNRRLGDYDQKTCKSLGIERSCMFRFLCHLQVTGLCVVHRMGVYVCVCVTNG